MKKFLISISILNLVYLFTGCDFTKEYATGYEDEIYVVADSADYNSIKGSLSETFEVQINTPAPEKLFTLKQIQPLDLDKFKNKKNLVIAASLNSNSESSKIIRDILDDQVKRKLNSEKNYIYYAYDLWAKDQIVAIITGNSLQEVDLKIDRNKDSLRTAFQKESDSRLKESLYNPKYEQKKIESRLLVDYGWIIYAHNDYKLVIEDKKNNFVLFKNSTVDESRKSVFVSWIDSASYLFLTPDSVKSIRNRITKKFLFNTNDSSYIVLIDSLNTTTEINFNGKFALYTQGLWMNTKNHSVGPFVNYMLYDEQKKRIYMLDGSIDAPRYYKRNLIQQIDIILQSFSTSYDLPQDRFDDLLDIYYKSFKK